MTKPTLTVHTTDTAGVAASTADLPTPLPTTAGRVELTVRGVAARPDGGAVVTAGVRRTGDRINDSVRRTNGLAVVAAGQLDPGFGTATVVFDPTGPADRVETAEAAAVLGDGRIVVAGTFAPLPIGPSSSTASTPGGRWSSGCSRRDRPH